MTEKVLTEAVRQRQRIPKSCVACLKGKRSCDRQRPSCLRCQEKNRICSYVTEPLEKPRLSGSKKQRRKRSDTPSSDAHITDLASPKHVSDSGTLNDANYSMSPNDHSPIEEMHSMAPSTNRNGHPLWYGGAAEIEPSIEINEGSTSDVRSALDGLLHPIADVFFQDATSNSSALPQFRRHAMKLLPSSEKAIRHFDDVRSYLRSALTGLLDDEFLDSAQKFLSESTMHRRDTISLPWLAVLFMILGLGQELNDNRRVSSHDHGMRYETLPADEEHLESDVYLRATHKALTLSSFHSSPNLQTIYAQLLMGLYLIHTERAATFWPILGSVTRQAQAIGLHVEPKQPYPDQQLRRRLWWAIVNQDVLLSSIFGRPLSITSFTCHLSEPNEVTCQTSNAQFSMLQRRHLMGNLFQEWTDDQLDEFKTDLLEWYNYSPLPVRITLNSESLIKDQDLRSQLSDKSIGAIEATTDNFIRVQYTLLSLYRTRLQSDNDKMRSQSHIICCNAIHNIVTGLSVMTDLLGTLQVGYIWLRIFYAFHAGISCAFIAVTRPGSEFAKQARNDLATLTTLCQRLPQRFKGIKIVNSTFAVLLRKIDNNYPQKKTESIPHTSTHTSPQQDSSQPSVESTAIQGTIEPALSDEAVLSSLDTSYDGRGSNSLSSWTGNIPEPFGPITDGPVSLESCTEILTFWTHFFSERSQPDDLNFE